MSCDWVSLLTNVTRLPRITVTLRGLTALFAIVIVAIPAFPPLGGGVVGVGDAPVLLVEPPPHPATTKASAPAAVIPPVNLRDAPIRSPRLKK